MLDKGLHSHHLRFTIINPHRDNLKQRIEALTCCEGILFCGRKETQTITPRVTILVKHCAVDVELSIGQLKGKNEEQVEDVS